QVRRARREEMCVIRADKRRHRFVAIGTATDPPFIVLEGDAAVVQGREGDAFAQPHAFLVAIGVPYFGMIDQVVPESIATKPIYAGEGYPTQDLRHGADQ